MANEIKVTDEQIIKLANGLCGNAQKAVKDAFPEIFGQEENWIDISKEVEFKKRLSSPGLVEIWHNGEIRGHVHLAYSHSFIWPADRNDYKIIELGETIRLLKRTR